ncbi:ABC transporter substrate-binding protein [Flindersiella endophytica]
MAAPTRRAFLAGSGSLLLGAAACGGEGFSDNTTPDSGGSGSKNPGRQTEIRMLVNITPNLTKAFWRDLVAPYEKANGVTVQVDAPTGSGVKDSLPQLLASGDVPDIVETLMADAKLAPHLADLGDQSWVSGTPLVEPAKLGGRTYTVGVGMQAQSLVYYNQDAFAKAGVDPLPQHLDELTAAMAKLKAAGYLPFQTAGDYVTGLQLLQLCWPSVIGSTPDWYQRVKAGKVEVGDSLLPYLELYQSWLGKGYLDKNALGLKDVDAQTAFFGGTSAMYVMGSWLVSTLAQNEAQADKSFKAGVFSAPTAAGLPYPGPMGATMALPYMVLKAGKNQQAARKLVQWLVTDKTAVAAQLKQDGNFKPGVDWCSTEVCGGVNQLLADAPSTTPQGEGYGDLTLPSGFNSEFNEAVQGLYVGRSPKQVAGDLDTWMEANGS